MSMSKLKNSPWKLAINILTIGALVVLAYALRRELFDTIQNLTHVNAWALWLLIPIELLNYHAQARLYQKLFKIVGNQLPYKFLFKMAVELNFVNHIFPSGGVTGISYFGVRLSKGNSISGGKATLIQIMKLAMTIVSFEVLIVFGVFSLAVMGRVNDLSILVATSLSTLVVVGTGLFIYIVGSKDRINNFFTFLTKALNSSIHIIIRSRPESININRVKALFNDFHDNYQQLKKHLKELNKPFWYALLANFTELLALYVVYIAFGKFINFGAIILAYAVANIAGFISVIPGGVGIYEGLMTAVLAAVGVPPQVSLPVTIMYRVLNTLLQVPPGYILYHQAINRGEVVPELANGN